MKSKIINILKFILSSIIFFYINVLIRTLLSYYFPAFLLDADHLNNIVTYVTLDDVIIFISCILIFYKLLKEDYIKIKNKVKGGSLRPYLKMMIKYTVLLFGVKLFSAFIISYLSIMFNITMNESNNQNLVLLLYKELPIIMIISGTVLAPLSEELIFRGAIRKILNKKGIFVAVSGLIFGLMHITDNMLILGSIFLIGLVLEMIYESKYNKKALLSVIAIALYLSILISTLILFKFDLTSYIKNLNVTEIINSVSYILMGLYLAYLYVKEDNILLNIGVHALNNLISFIAVMVVI